MQDCGFTPSQVREMEFLDVLRYAKYVQTHPSLRGLVEGIARSLGIELPDYSAPKQYMTGEELKRFVDMTGGRIEGVGQNG